MTNAEIQELIKKDKTRTLELKKSTGELKRVIDVLRFFPKSKVWTIQHINKTGHLKITYHRGERRA